MTVNRLSGFDASLLALESRCQPMNACTLYELDTSTIPGGYTFESFRDSLRVRVDGVPELRIKLADSRLNLDTPVWVTDPDFDIYQHVHRVELSVPGDRRELGQLAGRIAAEPLDRSRPLWDMWVIEGSFGADSPHIGLLFRVHHVLMDGQSGQEMWLRLGSTEADPPPLGPIADYGTVSARQLALDGLVRFARRPWLLVGGVLPATFTALVRSIRRAARREAMSRPWAAPRTLFNGDVGEDRNAAYLQLDLEDIKKVKNTFGVKINDVMLALVSGALREFLLHRAALPETALVAMMPVVDSVPDMDRAGRNHMSAVFSSLQTHIADPVQRLMAIAAASNAAKEHNSAMGTTLLQDWAQCLPSFPAVLMKLYTRSGLSSRRPAYNVSLSNVRAAEVQRYLVGAAMRANYPLGAVVNGVGVNISAVSLNGIVDMGIVACPRLLPDVWELADGIAGALVELQEAAS